MTSGKKTWKDLVILDSESEEFVTAAGLKPVVLKRGAIKDSDDALSKGYRRESERTPGSTVWVWRAIAFGDGSDRRAVIVVKRSPRPSENASILVSYIDKKKAKKIRGSATLK